jgi:tripartite-type tricarboxylate transporter receptor subunit TctC
MSRLLPVRFMVDSTLMASVSGETMVAAEQAVNTSHVSCIRWFAAGGSTKLSQDGLYFKRRDPQIV